VVQCSDETVHRLRKYFILAVNHFKIPMKDFREAMKWFSAPMKRFIGSRKGVLRR
jgi:hypothetical protein